MRTTDEKVATVATAGTGRDMILCATRPEVERLRLLVQGWATLKVEERLSCGRIMKTETSPELCRHEEGSETITIANEIVYGVFCDCDDLRVWRHVPPEKVFEFLVHYGLGRIKYWRPEGRRAAVRGRLVKAQYEGVVKKITWDEVRLRRRGIYRRWYAAQHRFGTEYACKAIGLDFTALRAIATGDCVAAPKRRAEKSAAKTKRTTKTKAAKSAA